MDEKLAAPSQTSQTGRRHYQRTARNLLIHKPMQREFSYVVIALLMISTLAIGFVINHTIHEASLGGGLVFGRISPYEVLSEVNHDLIMRVSIVLFITLIILGMFGVLFLHRVAGPMYRFRRILMQLNDGEIPAAFKIREGDFFTEIVTEFNQHLDHLRFEKETKTQLREKLDTLLAANPSDRLTQPLREMRAALDRQAR